MGALAVPLVLSLSAPYEDNISLAILYGGGKSLQNH